MEEAYKNMDFIEDSMLEIGKSDFKIVTKSNLLSSDDLAEIIKEIAKSEIHIWTDDLM